MKAKYGRVLIKVSGEALSGAKGSGFDKAVLDKVVDQIAVVVKEGVQVGIVVGGGNFWRGRQNLDMDRSTADYMGMLATVMNSLCLQEAFEKRNIPARVQTALEISHIAEPFNKKKAVKHLEKGEVVIFGGGTGCPFFSTDTTAALRASEIGAEVLLLAKNVDGIYDSDPNLNPDAKKFDEISYMDVVKRGLKAMDIPAVTMCMENNMPVFAFALNAENSIYSAVCGDDKNGTWIR